MVGPIRIVAAVATVAVAQSSSHWVDLYRERGYLVLPRLFEPERARELSEIVRSYLSDRGDRGAAHAYMMNGRRLGGWFVPGIERIPALRDFEAGVARDERLAKLLAGLLGDDFALLERSEIYVSRVGNWHADDLYGAFDLYAAALPYVDGTWCPERGPPDLPPMARPNVRGAKRPATPGEICAAGREFGFGKGTTFWAGEGGERRDIATVAVYLEDHEADDGGLSIAPRTHANATRHIEMLDRLDPYRKASLDEGATPFDVIKSRPGDAVVFDSRSVHRGARSRYADFTRDLARSRRTVASFSFGRRNAVSEAFSRGMRFRTDLLVNASLCAAHRDGDGDPDFGGPCAFGAVREDLAKRPMRGVPDGAPFLVARRSLARRGRRPAPSAPP